MTLANKNHTRRNRETHTRTRINNKTPKNYDKFEGTKIWVELQSLVIQGSQETSKILHITHIRILC